MKVVMLPVWTWTALSWPVKIQTFKLVTSYSYIDMRTVAQLYRILYYSLFGIEFSAVFYQDFVYLRKVMHRTTFFSFFVCCCFTTFDGRIK